MYVLRARRGFITKLGQVQIVADIALRKATQMGVSVSKRYWELKKSKFFGPVLLKPQTAAYERTVKSMRELMTSMNNEV